MNRSDEVRDFYERMPYPAPLTNLDEHRNLYKNQDRRRAEFHLMWPDRATAGKPGNPGRWLRYVAGRKVRTSRARCSNHGDRRQRHEPAVHARSSAQVQSGEISNCTNSRSRASAEIGRLFDQVVCTGVLHHLPDPDFGLRALRDVLQPNGAMRLMVYARYGRTGIYMMQEYCRLLEINASAADLRDLGATLETLPPDHPISGLLRRSEDFWRPKRWRTRSFIPKIAPTPSRSCMRGSTDAACPLDAGLSRRPTLLNAAW